MGILLVLNLLKVFLKISYSQNEDIISFHISKSMTENPRSSEWEIHQLFSYFLEIPDPQNGDTISFLIFKSTPGNPRSSELSSFTAQIEFANAGRQFLYKKNSLRRPWPL